MITNLLSESWTFINQCNRHDNDNQVLVSSSSFYSESVFSGSDKTFDKRILLFYPGIIDNTFVKYLDQGSSWWFSTYSQV